MKFKVSKPSGGLLNQNKPVIFQIEKDEFFFKKKESEENFKRYHISYLNEVYIEGNPKDNTEFILNIGLYNKNITNKKEDKDIEIVKIYPQEKKDNPILSEIKKVLNIKKLQYDLNLFLLNYKQLIGNSLKSEQLKEVESKINNKSQSNELNENIKKTLEQKNIKEKLNTLFSSKLNDFIEKLNKENFDITLLDDNSINKCKELINGNLSNELIEIKSLNVLTEQDINKLNFIYSNLLKLLKQIRFCFILKRFKMSDKQ